MNSSHSPSKKRSRKFAHKTFLIMLVANFYVGWSLMPNIHMSSHAMALVSILSLNTSALIAYGTMARQFINNQKTIDKLVFIGGLVMFWSSSLLVLTIIRELLLIISFFEPWRNFSATTVILITSALTAIGYRNARQTAKIKRVQIQIDKLPPALHNFQIIQLTDIHVGSTIKHDYVNSIVTRVNSVNADLIAITGDIVDNTVENLKFHTHPLSKLQARHGAYIVTGNHEYYSGADDWIIEFKRLGLNCLLNEHKIIDHNTAKIAIAGVNDFSAIKRNHIETSAALHNSDPYKAAAGIPINIPKILLAHQPRSAFEASNAGYDLQLSGHTHGGQFWPWNFLVRVQQPFTAGLYRLNNLWVYVSRGTGYWGPPIRIGAPSEITLITLIG